MFRRRISLSDTTKAECWYKTVSVQLVEALCVKCLGVCVCVYVG